MARAIDRIISSRRPTPAASRKGPAAMLIRSVERFLRENRMSATKFGRLATNDPRFVLDLRLGREPRRAMESRVEHFMNTYRDAAHV